MKSIWISRPSARAQLLAAHCRESGLKPLCYPAITITPVATTDACVQRYFKQIKQYKLSLFISADAAHYISNYIDDQLAWSGDNNQLLYAVAIGKHTATALHSAYTLVATPPDSISDSLHLLTTLSLTPPAIVAVIGGNNQSNDMPSPPLCEALHKQGIGVEPIVCYQRSIAPPNNELSQLGNSGGVNAAVAYSTETLTAMLAMIHPYTDWLLNTPLFVIHSNIEKAAKQLGFKKIMVVSDSSQMAIAIRDYFANTSS